MKHCGTQKLETDRLILRKYIAEDAIAMYKNWASDKEVTKFLTWPAHSNPEISQSIINNWVSRYSNDDYYHWAILLKDNGEEPIGDIAVLNIKENTSTAHIGYCIGRAWWHQGITSEALKAVMDFLFDRVDIKRIEASLLSARPVCRTSGIFYQKRYTGNFPQCIFFFISYPYTGYALFS